MFCGYRVRLATIFSLFLLSGLSLAAAAQSVYTGPTHIEPSMPQTPVIVPQMPVQTPQIPQVKIDIPVLNLPQPPQAVLPLVPTDLVQPLESMQSGPVREKQDVLSGIKILDSRDLPADALASQPEGIVVKYKPGTEFTRPSSCAVQLKSGRILVSVRRPSKLAIIDTELASARLSADADVELFYADGVLHFINLSGLGKKVMLELKSEHLPAQLAEKVISLSPGFEMIVSDHRLHISELRPSDGYARRFFKRLENGQLAISEISVESVLKASDLVAELKQSNSGAKERRILADLSKMAAVLNYVNGSAAYEAQPKASLSVDSRLSDQDL